MNFTPSTQHYFDLDYRHTYQPDADQQRRSGEPATNQQRRPQVRQPANYRNMTPPLPHDRLYSHIPQNQTEFIDDANDSYRVFPESVTTNSPIPDATSAPGNANASFHPRIADGLIVSRSHRTQFERCRQIAHLLREEDMRNFANQQGEDAPMRRQLHLTSTDALNYLNATLLPPSLSMPPRTRDRSKRTRPMTPPSAAGQPFEANDPAAHRALDAYFPAPPAEAVQKQRNVKRQWADSNDRSESSDLTDDMHRHVTHRPYPDGRQAPQPAADAVDLDDILRKV